MPFDLTPMDAVALIWFLAVWATYNLVVDHFVRRPVTLNRNMRAVRAAWMRRMLDRENRVMDSMLIGHLISSVSFFASTTVLVLAGLLGLFGALDQVFGLLADLTFTAKTTKTLFELKVLLLLGIFTFAFFKFTWALRQFNYGVALVGAAPPAPVPERRRDVIAGHAADVLSLAVSNFNGGLRSYYFGFAALSWFIHPSLLMAFTAGILLVLLRRHLVSATFRSVRGYSRAISEDGSAEDEPARFQGEGRLGAAEKGL